MYLQARNYNKVQRCNPRTGLNTLLRILIRSQPISGLQCLLEVDDSQPIAKNTVTNASQQTEWMFHSNNVDS